MRDERERGVLAWSKKRCQFGELRVREGKSIARSTAALVREEQQALVVVVVVVVVVVGIGSPPDCRCA